MKYINNRIISVTLLGFFSGLPLALSSGTLQAWFAVSGIDIVNIGLLAFVGIPYTYKFIWAPLIDKYSPLFLENYRGWILFFQLLLVFFIFCFSFFNPSKHAIVLGSLGLIVAFLSASQDISVDAYRVCILEPKERGLGVAFSVEAYRLAMLISGPVALIIADRYGFEVSYLMMAGLMFLGIFITFFIPKITINKKHQDKYLIKGLIGKPIKDFFKREKASLFLLLIICYKLGGEAFAGSFTTVFMLRHLDMTLTEVSFINKMIGMVAMVLGVFCGGALMVRIRLFTALVFFGVLQILSNMGLVVLAIVGKNYLLASAIIFFENLCNGMGTAALVSLLMVLCNKEYSATQYALLSSFVSFGRVYLVPVAGIIVKYVGWIQFYVLTVFLVFPALILLFILRKEIFTLEFKEF